MGLARTADARATAETSRPGARIARTRAADGVAAAERLGGIGSLVDEAGLGPPRN